MASRLILKEIKAPIHFLLRSPAESAPLPQTIQTLLVPISRQSAAEFSKSGIVRELGSIDRPLLSRASKSTFDGGLGFRIEVRGKRESDIEDVDEMVESESDVEDFDAFSGDYGEESGGEFFDDGDTEPRDDEF